MGLIIWRALTETRACFDWAHKWVWICVGVATGPATWFYLWLFGQSKAVYEMMNGAAAAIAALVTIAIIIFLINLCRAPVLIINEMNRTIAAMRDEKAVIADNLKPSISVLYEANEKPPFYHADLNFKLLRIGIRNEGYTGISGVKVKLVEVFIMSDGYIDRPYFEGKLPAELHLKGNNPPDLRKKEFTINARSCEYIDVVQWVFVPTVQSAPILQFWWVEQDHPLVGVFGCTEYEFAIEVTSPHGDRILKRYRTKLDPFRLEEVANYA